MGEDGGGGWRWQSDGGVKAITVWARSLTSSSIACTPVVVCALGGRAACTHEQKARWQLVMSRHAGGNSAIMAAVVAAVMEGDGGQGREEVVMGCL